MWISHFIGTMTACMILVSGFYIGYITLKSVKIVSAYYFIGLILGATALIQIMKMTTGILLCKKK